MPVSTARKVEDRVRKTGRKSEPSIERGTGAGTALTHARRVTTQVQVWGQQAGEPKQVWEEQKGVGSLSGWVCGIRVNQAGAEVIIQLGGHSPYIKSPQFGPWYPIWHPKLQK